MTVPPPLTHGTAALAAAVRLRYVVAGDGPTTVVLLHGYPRTWWQWRHVLPRLTGAGFRVVADALVAFLKSNR